MYVEDLPPDAEVRVEGGVYGYQIRITYGGRILENVVAATVRLSANYAARVTLEYRPRERKPGERPRIESAEHPAKVAMAVLYGEGNRVAE